MLAGELVLNNQLLEKMAETKKSTDVEEEADLWIAMAQASERDEANDPVRALAKLAEALAIDPGRAGTWLRVGKVYVKLMAWAQAVPALETALRLQPDLQAAQHLLAYSFYCLGRHDEAIRLIDDLCHRSNVPDAWFMRAYIHSHVNRDYAKTLQVHQDWGRRFADPLTRKAKRLVVADRNPRKKLRVGYVTADFCEHSVAFFMLPVLRHHNPDVVDVHVYSSGRSDGVTELIRQYVPHWSEVRDIGDEALVEKIRADCIDILVDLSGYTAGNRLLVFARRAAPVQVTWLGYMQPLGMKAMDYRLTDAGITPPEHEQYYSEKLFYLACMASYAPPTYAPLCAEPPMLKNGYPTLVSLNNSSKITDAMLRIWARILELRPDARLIIMVKERDPDSAQANMQPRVEAAGMPLDRVSVLHQQPLNQFMELGHIADIALDTSPISGGTTTLHALWMGMLLVTMDAERGVDASTARTLGGLGFGGEIAKDEQGYVDAALLLMNSPERLQQQRLNSRDQLRKSVLMDYATRTAELEKSFQLMWLNWLAGKHLALDTTADLGALLADMEASA